MAEELNYKGYRLLVSPVGKGWRAMIFPPGSSSALLESPATLEKSPKEAIVAEARKIVDGRGQVRKVPESNSGNPLQRRVLIFQTYCYNALKLISHGLFY